MAVAAIESRLDEIGPTSRRPRATPTRLEASESDAPPVQFGALQRLLIGDDCTITGELAEPSDVLLGEELRQAVVARETQAWRETADAVIQGRNEQGPRKPGR